MHLLHGTQVDGAQDNLEVLAWLHIRLQRGLSVQLNGHVDHIASIIQAIGRRVCPPACQVDAHRTSRPHNLVGIDSQTRRLSVGKHGGGQSLTQQGEGLRLFLTSVFALQLQVV